MFVGFDQDRLDSLPFAWFIDGGAQCLELAIPRVQVFDRRCVVILHDDRVALDPGGRQRI